MRKFVLSICSFFILILTACNQSGKKTSDINSDADTDAGKNGSMSIGSYSIDAPAGWDKSDTTVMGFKTVVLMSPLQPGDHFRENVNVVTEKAPELTLESYFDLNKSNMGKMLSEYQTLGEGDVSIGGLRAKWLQYAHNYMGTPIKAKSFLVIHNGQAYIITCSALDSEYDKYENEFHQAVNSFRVK